MALDYAAILQAGQGLVPDLREQMFKSQELKLRQETMRQQQEARKLAMTQAQEAAARKAAFQARASQLMSTGKPGDIYRLMVEFPEFADQLKTAATGLSDDQKRTTLTQAGTVYTRALGGDRKGAAALIDQRIAADKAAGIDTAEDEQIRDALLSDDEQQQKIALGTMASHIAALAGPEKYGETFGKLSGVTDKTAVQKEYEWRVQQFGKPAADTWLATTDEKFVPVQAGGSVYRASDLMGATPPPAQPKGGDPKPSAGEGNPTKDGVGVIKALFPSAQITSNYRPKLLPGQTTPTYHNSGRAAVDVAPIPGMTFEQYVAKIKAAGHSIIEARDEVKNPSKHATGPHWHVVIGEGGASGPVRIKSKQQYDKLPKGAEYIAPDGSHRRKN